jgi:hypothetical protein
MWYAILIAAQRLFHLPMVEERICAVARDTDYHGLFMANDNPERNRF